MYTDIHTLGIHMAQSRSYSNTLDPNVGIVYILGSPGIYKIRALTLGWLQAQKEQEDADERAKRVERLGMHVGYGHGFLL